METVAELLFPNQGPLDLAALEARLGALNNAPVLPPFDAATLALFARLHAALQQDEEARRHPELQAFAFWIRPKAIERLAARHRSLSGDGLRLLPKGTVFHLPPGNVALLFAYCWTLSLLAGNRNIVRLSSRRGAPTDVLLRLIATALADAPDIAAGQMILTYGHDDRVTETLSSVSDLRMVWGGDETVKRLRCIALPVGASELSFPDRFSYAAFDAQAVLEAKDAFDDLVDRFYDDVFWFDQMACSSPKLAIWVGTPDQCASASEHFYSALGQRAAQRGYALDAGTLCAKLAYVFEAVVEKPVMRCRWFGGRLAVLEVAEFPDIRGESFGGGILYDLQLGNLAALAPYVRRKDQTLVHYGFGGVDLSTFATALAGRGLDRLVPVGQALAFDSVWDGHDLFSAFSRRVSMLCSR